MEEREIVEHGKALKAIRHTDGFRALEALIERKDRDLFRRWSSGFKEGDRELTKDWCDGYLALARELVSGVDEMIGLADQRDPITSEQAAAVSGAPLGRGDLAL